MDFKKIGLSILGRLGFPPHETVITDSGMSHPGLDVPLVEDPYGLFRSSVSADLVTEVAVSHDNYSVTRKERVIGKPFAGFGAVRQEDWQLNRRYSPDARTGNECDVFLQAIFARSGSERLPSKIIVEDLSCKAFMDYSVRNHGTAEDVPHSIIFKDFQMNERPTFTTSGILEGSIEVTPLRRSASGRLYFEARGKPLAYLLRAEDENLWFKIWVPTRPRSLKEAVIRAGTTLGIEHPKIPAALGGLQVFTRAAIVPAFVVALYVGLSFFGQDDLQSESPISSRMRMVG
ncbi:MAG: hypothetical protein HYT76_07180 [Deltaproteobacteria bacterium]|nr:hypothetical protein [Deltaproteobacteria bacterium]